MPGSSAQETLAIRIRVATTSFHGSDMLTRRFRVKAQVPDAHLLLIGTGSKKTELEQLSRGLNVGAQFLGRVSDTERREWLARARMFVGASITATDGDAEALGMVFAESQATGLLVVSCITGAFRRSSLMGRPGWWSPSVILMPLQLTSFDYSRMSPFGRHAAPEPRFGWKNDLIWLSKLKNWSRSILLS